MNARVFFFKIIISFFSASSRRIEGDSIVDILSEIKSRLSFCTRHSDAIYKAIAESN